MVCNKTPAVKVCNFGLSVSLISTHRWPTNTMSPVLLNLQGQGQDQRALMSRWAWASLEGQEQRAHIPLNTGHGPVPVLQTAAPVPGCHPGHKCTALACLLEAQALGSSGVGPVVAFKLCR